MTAPKSLIDVEQAPAWLRGLVSSADSLEARTFTRFQPPSGSRPRSAAVLLLFSEGADGRPDVLLQRRAEGMTTHAGQVSFPGGRAEDGDGGPVGTALREAEEETGLDPSGVTPLALLPALWVPVSDHLVTPVLAHWHAPSRVYAADPAETAAVLRVGIDTLTDPRNRFQVERDGWKGPAFAVDDVLVWGFTAGILSVVLRLGGWEKDWDAKDVRPLDVALREHHGGATWRGGEA